MTKTKTARKAGRTRKAIKSERNIYFLDLPLEIRLLIYHFMFVIDTANGQWRKYAKSKSSHDVLVEGLGRCTSPETTTMQCSFVVSALRVCKEIYEHGTKLLYGHNEFVVGVRVNADERSPEVSALLSTLKYARFDLISFLTLTVTFVGFHGFHKGPMADRSKLVVSRLTSLKRIQLAIVVAADRWEVLRGWSLANRELALSEIVESEENGNWDQISWLCMYISSVLQVLPKDTEIVCQDDGAVYSRVMMFDEVLSRELMEKLVKRCEQMNDD